MPRYVEGTAEEMAAYRRWLLSKPNPFEARQEYEVQKVEGLPVAGYQAQPHANVELVNINKRLEEQVLRQFDFLKTSVAVDQRWLAIARTGLEEAFMAANRAIFKPSRIALPGDDAHP